MSSFALCARCDRHVRAGEACPFCATPRAPIAAAIFAALLAGGACKTDGAPSDPQGATKTATVTAPTPDPAIPVPPYGVAPMPTAVPAYGIAPVEAPSPPR